MGFQGPIQAHLGRGSVHPLPSDRLVHSPPLHEIPCTHDNAPRWGSWRRKAAYYRRHIHRKHGALPLFPLPVPYALLLRCCEGSPGGSLPSPPRLAAPPSELLLDLSEFLAPFFTLLYLRSPLPATKTVFSFVKQR